MDEGYAYTFLMSRSDAGYVLKIDVAKSRDVKKAWDGVVYIRRGAQNLPVTTPEALTRLHQNKRLVSFETEPVGAEPELITNPVYITADKYQSLTRKASGATLNS